ncbi:MAG: tyrosine--tRNA ligase [Calditrichota bacterium]
MISQPLSFIEDLNARGLIAQITNMEGICQLLAEGETRMYIGFDPTADSLHIGSLLPLVVLARLQRQGHRPIIVVGGATGMVGDPSGRSGERQLLSLEAIAENLAALRRQIAGIIDFEGKYAAIMVDNLEWTSRFTYLDWLRDVGKYFTINYMVAKESVRARMEDREQGISYTEFSYMLLQAYDFLHLFDHYGCRIQGGGQDQWGNITAGIDLIRRLRGQEAYGITFPLITTASGEKFGKSLGNAVWLDPARTSPFQFYQYWMRTDDRDMERYLKMFTFLDLIQIQELLSEQDQAPEKRIPHTALANELTRMIHGADGLSKAQQATAVLYGKEISGLTDEELSDIFADVPSTQVSRAILEAGIRLDDLLKLTSVFPSKGEARRRIQAGGVYVNNRRETYPERVLRPDMLASRSLLVLRTGKAHYHLVRFV